MKPARLHSDPALWEEQEEARAEAPREADARRADEAEPSADEAQDTTSAPSPEAEA